MKKIITLLLAFIGVMLVTLTGCSNRDTFTEKTYTSGETQIREVTIEVTDRELEVSASDDARVYIDYFDGEKEHLDITVSDNKELTVTLATDKNWTDYIGTKASIEYRKIKIKLPDGLLATFSAKTSNESIKINSLSFTDSVNLQTSDGDILCERVNVGSAISLTAKNGDIKGSVIGGWDDFSISCRIKKGECNLPLNKQGGEKSFSADCNNGDIAVEFVK